MVSKQKEGGNGKVRHCTRGTPTTPQQPHPSCAFSISAFSFSFLSSILFILQQCYGGRIYTVSLRTPGQKRVHTSESCQQVRLWVTLPACYV